jgi:hypothetical protein
MPIKVIIITAGTQITLPSDWNSGNNSIECIGGGGGGSFRNASAGGSGGTGGGYAKLVNFGSPGQSLTISIGTGGAGSSTTSTTNGGNTWVSNTGSAPTSAAQGVLARGGGQATTQVGTLTYLGGAGGAAWNSTNYDSGGGGGGAAGLSGAGLAGGDGQSDAYGGDGGAGSSARGGVTAGNTAGNAGAQWQATTNAITGTGLTVLSAGATAGAGSGGGGLGGTNYTISGYAGGLYGGGGGGGNYSGAGGGWAGGAGRPGLIVLTYRTGSLPSSGAINLSQANTELGNASTASISLGSAAVRSLAGVSTGAIAMSNLYGKATIPTLTTTLTAGQVTDTAKIANTLYGYSSAAAGNGLVAGAMANTTFNGATIQGLYCYWNNTIVVSGNRAANFITSVTVNGTSLGPLTLPTYDATNNVTTFCFGNSLDANPFPTNGGVYNIVIKG